MVVVKLVYSLQDVPPIERNLGLVVEVPFKHYEDSYARSANENLAINHNRWEYVAEFHVIMPNIRQLSVHHSLQWCHYHYDKDAFVKAVSASGILIDGVPIPVHVHYPGVNVLDAPFLRLLNVDFDEETSEMMSSIPWKEIASSAFTGETKKGGEKKGKMKSQPAKIGKGKTKSQGSKKKKNQAGKKKDSFKRQQYFIDVGYTSGACLTGKDGVGNACPVTKPSTDDIHIQAMVALSRLLKKHAFDDLQERIYEDTVFTTRREDWAQLFHPDNLLEALRSALSNVLHPCGCHTDNHNDKHPNFSPVVTYSVFVMVNGKCYRLAIIGYSRRTIREYYERCKKPNARLMWDIKRTLDNLPESRTFWDNSIRIIGGPTQDNPHSRLGDTELGFVAVPCHMNCFHYLSAWIHFASQLITRFSLSFEETVGLLLGMYCDNNPISFVLVAKDLLEEDIADVSTINFGLTVRKLMMEKRTMVKAKFGAGFTFPSRFRHFWKEDWKDQMVDQLDFEKQKTNVSKECRRQWERCSKVGNRKDRLSLFVSLATFLNNELFGVGELCCKHLIPMFSVIGVLPKWFSTMSSIKATSKNYDFLVKNYHIGGRQQDANTFMRSLFHAVNRPLQRDLSSDGSGSNVRTANPTTADKQVDLFVSENVVCKYVRMKKEQPTDRNYFDTLFLYQYLYIPNVKNNSLSVFRPNESHPRILSSGSLHQWDLTTDVSDLSSTSGGKKRKAGAPTLKATPATDKIPTTATTTIPRKRASTRPTIGSVVPRQLRASNRRASLKVPPPASQPQLRASNTRAPKFLWVPRDIDRRKGFHFAYMKPTRQFDNVKAHVQMIEEEEGSTSSLGLENTEKRGRRQVHTLKSVSANGTVYQMKDVDLSVVFALFPTVSIGTSRTDPTFSKKKDAENFGHLFLLLMVYPHRWFNKLYGTPSAVENYNFVVVGRQGKAMFVVQKVGEDIWHVTPKEGYRSFEYK